MLSYLSVASFRIIRKLMEKQTKRSSSFQVLSLRKSKVSDGFELPLIELQMINTISAENKNRLLLQNKFWAMKNIFLTFSQRFKVLQTMFWSPPNMKLAYPW